MAIAGASTTQDSHHHQGVTPQIVVLISGNGSNLQALIDATAASKALDGAHISLVISNRKAAYGLTRASAASIPTDVFALKPYLNHNPGKTREDYDLELAKRVLEGRPTLVVLAGFMHVVSPAFLEAMVWETNGEKTRIPIINLHPALPGAFDGVDAIRRAHEAFERSEIDKTGVMVHEVVAEVDRGRPILVREIMMTKGETLEQLEARIHSVEHDLLVSAVARMLWPDGRGDAV